MGQKYDTHTIQPNTQFFINLHKCISSSATFLTACLHLCEYAYVHVHVYMCMSICICACMCVYQLMHSSLRELPTDISLLNLAKYLVVLILFLVKYGPNTGSNVWPIFDNMATG